MFSIIMLLVAIITVTMSFLSWEQGAKGWWVWALMCAIASFVYVSGIHS